MQGFTQAKKRLTAKPTALWLYGCGNVKIQKTTADPPNKDMQGEPWFLLKTI